MISAYEGILLAGAPEILNTVQSAVQMIVYAIGGVIALIGGVDALSGYSNQSSGKMSEGIVKAVGGAGIILLGFKLIPAIFENFSITAFGIINFWF